MTVHNVEARRSNTKSIATVVLGILAAVLVATNVLTLLNNRFHNFAYQAISPFVPSSMLEVSPTVAAKLQRDAAVSAAIDVMRREMQSSLLKAYLENASLRAAWEILSRERQAMALNDERRRQSSSRIHAQIGARSRALLGRTWKSIGFDFVPVIGHAAMLYLLLKDMVDAWAAIADVSSLKAIDGVSPDPESFVCTSMKRVPWMTQALSSN